MYAQVNRAVQKIVLEGGELPVTNLKGLNAKTSRTLDLSRQNLTFISSVFIGMCMACSSMHPMRVCASASLMCMACAWHVQARSCARTPRSPSST